LITVLVLRHVIVHGTFGRWAREDIESIVGVARGCPQSVKVLRGAKRKAAPLSKASPLPSRSGRKRSNDQAIGLVPVFPSASLVEK
jgi:hypothetical protein